MHTAVQIIIKIIQLIASVRVGITIFLLQAFIESR